MGSESVEIDAFKKARLWGDGFMDSDPLRPLGWSSYTSNGFISVYHAVYQACIKPYVSDKTVALEIGPGLGAWTKSLLAAGAPRVYALDVQPATKDGFDKYLGEFRSRAEYIVVKDCSGAGVPDEGAGFFWSFGTFVHLSPKLQSAYLNMIASKLKRHAHGFIQFADFDIWNNVVTSPEYMIHHWMRSIVGGEKGETVFDILDSHDWVRPREPLTANELDLDRVNPGRYFYVGTNWISEAITKAGLKVIEPNVFPSLRDPVIHFIKP